MKKHCYARSYDLDLEEGQVATENPSYESEYTTYIFKVEVIQKK